MREDPEGHGRNLDRLLGQVSQYLRTRGGMWSEGHSDLVQEVALRLLQWSQVSSVESGRRWTGVALAVAKRVWLEALAEQMRWQRTFVRPDQVAGDRDSGAEMGGWDRLDGWAGAAGDGGPGEELSNQELQEAVLVILRGRVGDVAAELFGRVWLAGVSWAEAAAALGLTEQDCEAARKRFWRFLSAREGSQSLKEQLSRLGVEVDRCQPPTPHPQPRRESQ